MFGSDFIVIKDNRGFKTGFHWSDVHTVLENYEKDLKCVKVKFRLDPEGSRPLKFIMTLDEFLGQVEGQLSMVKTKPGYVAPNRVTIAPLSNPYPDGPADQIET
jgi:hypothetical protein